MSPEQILHRALARQAAGDLSGAIADYRALLVLLPQEPSAAANSAAAWLALGRPDRALTQARIAARLAPGLAATQLILAESAQGAGDEAAARQSFRRAWLLQPDAPETNNNLANFLSAAGEEERAIAFYRRTLLLAPRRAEAYANLAACLLAAHCPADSEGAARAALALAPERAEAWNNLGNVLFELRAYEAALSAFRRARRIVPSFTDACINEGGLRLDLGQAEEGAALSRLALVLAPDLPGPYNNLGNAALLAGRLAEADAVFRRALLIAPHDAQLHFNRAAALLKQGKMQEGWAEYEWRRRTASALRRRRPDDPPDWPGGDPAGRTLLLSGEQGYGDVLQFCRFAPWLAARGARVVLRVERPLIRLMRSLPGVERVIAPDEVPPSCDVHLPLMSVPGAFGLSLAEIPAQLPYLAAKPAAVKGWKRRLDSVPGIKIGLVWSGDPRPGQRAAHLLDRRRSLSLAQLGVLSKVEGMTLISLQKGAPAAQLAEAQGLAVIDWTQELDDFADTAALVSALDLVISVDTAVAHLAGALGRPVWILSRFDGCWRWLEERQDSPWYPTARLFRQKRPGDWTAPLDALRQALKSLR